MLFLPYEDFYIITKLKPEEAESKLQQEVSPGDGRFFKLSMFSSSSGSYFEGYAVNGLFEFKRNISYRNSFLPQIKGSIEPDSLGSRIHVKMGMLIFVIVFMCVWLGFAAIGGFAFLTQEINKGGFASVDFAPFCMFLFGYALMMGGFKFESRKAKAYLLELLEGEAE